MVGDPVDEDADEGKEQHGQEGGGAVAGLAAAEEAAHVIRPEHDKEQQQQCATAKQEVCHQVEAAGDEVGDGTGND